MIDFMDLGGALAGYLRQHPDELWRIAKNAAALRVGVPLAAFRWILEHANTKGTLRDIELEAAPPGVRIALSVKLLGTPLRASGIASIDEVHTDRDELRVRLRLRDVQLKVLDPNVETPVATLIRSGALDLGKPGNLVAYMPRRPAFLVEAKDDHVTLDFAKHPKLDKRIVRQLLGLLTPLVGIRSIETDFDHLNVALGAFPTGVAQAWDELRPW